MTTPNDSLPASSPDPAVYARQYLDHVVRVLARIDPESVALFIAAVIEARGRGARIFFIGNGGSAATASHFANDLAIGSRSWSKPFRAISLTDNVPVLTAIANDYGYEHVFTKQLETQLSPADVVVAISASGNSPNVLNAIEYAKAQGATTIGLTGFDGGRLAKIVRHAVHVPTEQGEYGPVEDAHMVLDHLVGGYVIHFCRRESEINV